MAYPILIIFALLPSLIWLLFYLRKDAHPESNSMVLIVFFLGMFFALPVIFIELGFANFIEKISLPDIFIFILNSFIGIAFFEELFKYLVVRLVVLRSAEMDEPLDIVLYMIISALGFAFLENLLIFFSPDIFSWKIEQIFFLSGFRFISATFLHALTSGILGFFMALSFFKAKKKKTFLFIGFFLATVLHGFYNWGIIILEEIEKVLNATHQNNTALIFFWITILLITLMISVMAIFVSLGFKKLKKIASVCKIK